MLTKSGSMQANSVNLLEEFRKWLSSEKNYSSRSIGDVVSRLKRVSRMLDIEVVMVDLDCLDRLKLRDDFRSLTYSARSQLYASVRHFSNFKNSALINKKK